MSDKSFERGSRKFASGLDGPHVKLEITDESLDANQIKSLFYLARIAEILFPNNIPHVSRAWFDDQTKHGKYESLKVEHDELHSRLQKLRANVHGSPDDPEWIQVHADLETAKSDPDYVEFVTKAQDAGLTGYELHPMNFSRDSDGNLKFFDFEPAWYQDEWGDWHLRFDPAKLISAIHAIESPSDQIAAINSYRRIRELVPVDLKARVPEYDDNHSSNQITL